MALPLSVSQRRKLRAVLTATACTAWGAYVVDWYTDGQLRKAVGSALSNVWPFSSSPVRASSSHPLHGERTPRNSNSDLSEEQDEGWQRDGQYASEELGAHPSEEGWSRETQLAAGKEGREGEDEEEEEGEKSLPDFFASTKFFACLNIEDSKELFQQVEWMNVEPFEVLFRQGDASEGGMYIVAEGTMGVYSCENRWGPGGLAERGPPQLMNILRPGESVGDVDVIDGHPRSVTCRALEDGAVVVRVSRALFLEFIMARPKILNLYLRQAVARLWRVAHFMLTDFLALPSAQAVLDVGGSPPTPNAGRSWWGGSSGVATPSTPTPRPLDRLASTCSLAAAECAEERWAQEALEGLRRGASSATLGDAVEISLAPFLDFFETSPAVRRQVLLTASPLYELGANCNCMYVLLSGKLVAEPRHASAEEANTSTWSGWDTEGMGEDPSSSDHGQGQHVLPCTVIGAASFLTSIPRMETVRAAQPSTLAIFAAEDLEHLLAANKDAYLQLHLAAAQALMPIIRRFICLGLNRVWLASGDAAYVNGEPAASMYVLIGGRLRLLHGEQPRRRVPSSAMASPLTPPKGGDSSGGGGFVPPAGGSWLEGAKYTDVGRGEVVGQASLLTGEPHHDTALCVRDSELVRMSRPAFERICRENPQCTVRLMDSMAKQLRAADTALSFGCVADHRSRPSELVTVALVPSARAAHLVHPFASHLTSALERFGRTLHLSSTRVSLMFGDGTGSKLHLSFYRSKLTFWMTHQEETYRFILLEADPTNTPWTQICISQADLVLVVADPRGSPEVGKSESTVLWQGEVGLPGGKREGSDAKGKGTGEKQEGGAATGGVQGLPAGHGTRRKRMQLLRVELCLLHKSLGSESSSDGRQRSMYALPRDTILWLKARPKVKRHHHVRIGVDGDVLRIARYIAGKAVGLVLSGGGSRGLAHLGAIRALEDAGVPIDFVGGTSQGAFMCALYAKYTVSGPMVRPVREFAAKLGSTFRRIQDLTLPVVALFNGAGFSQSIREALGPTQIEDLWLPFFCISTNVTKGDMVVHDKGSLWKYVRASMTVVGYLPPVYEDGDLLVDGGYVNNVPVDVMRAQGVDTVIVVDVEDKTNSAFSKVTPYDDGQLSGWWLLWDRINPFPHTRFRLPPYSELVNALTYMSHTRQLRSVEMQYSIDLCLRPTGHRTFKLLDYHLMEDIVQSAYRYGWAALTEWLRDPRSHHVPLLHPLGRGLGRVERGLPMMPPRATMGSDGSKLQRSMSSSSMGMLSSKLSPLFPANRQPLPPAPRIVPPPPMVVMSQNSSPSMRSSLPLRPPPSPRGWVGWLRGDTKAGGEEDNGEGESRENVRKVTRVVEEGEDDGEGSGHGAGGSQRSEEEEEEEVWNLRDSDWEASGLGEIRRPKLGLRGAEWASGGLERARTFSGPGARRAPISQASQRSSTLGVRSLVGVKNWDRLLDKPPPPTKDNSKRIKRAWSTESLHDSATTSLHASNLDDIPLPRRPPR